jgi:hypothetical protein
MSAAFASSFGGVLTLHLSDAGPRIELPVRPDLTTLLADRPAQAAVDLLPRLYALCGHAHALAAQLAIDAARGLRTEATLEEGQALVTETIKEHVRCLFFDWPLQLDALADGDAARRQSVLAACPLFRAPSDPNAARHWLRAHVLGCDPAQWLAQSETHERIAAWCAVGATLPARWLGAVLNDALTCARSAAPELPGAPTIEFRATLWQSLLGPYPPGQPGSLETGCWLRTRRGRAARDAADRLIGRLRDLALLALDPPAPLRAWGWSPLPGAALAWVEMARGVLIHAMQLDRARATIVRYRIMAPTDWNFAPHGPVARALRDIMGERDAASRTRRARIIATAYAPCYPFAVDITGTEPACTN